MLLMVGPPVTGGTDEVDTRSLPAAEECRVPGVPAAGTWVEWILSGDTITLGVLPASAGGYRLESSGPDGAGHLVTVQVVGSGYPAASIHDFAEAVLEVGEGPAMRLTGAMLGTLSGRRTGIATLLGVSCLGLEDGGASMAEIAGRRIDLRIWRNRDGTRELGLSPSVPFGIVRWQGSGARVTLLRWGSGYTTRLKTKPMDLPAVPPPR